MLVLHLVYLTFLHLYHYLDIVVGSLLAFISPCLSLADLCLYIATRLTI